MSQGKTWHSIPLNPLRRHSSLAMLSPDEYERQYWEDNAAAAAA